MSSRKKAVDKSSEFEAFIEQTSEYLPPSVNKHDATEESKQLNKQQHKQFTTKTNTRKKKLYIADLFEQPVAKEKMINTTLQLPESLNRRLKKFCSEFGNSKNEVIRTLVEALLDEKGF
ncbi:MAG: hypothetical protein RLZZ04_4323 [Cyanobacteriota bacterium]|jgi:c-di-AMP phosphodiesterase-like protein